MAATRGRVDSAKLECHDSYSELLTDLQLMGVSY